MLRGVITMHWDDRSSVLERFDDVLRVPRRWCQKSLRGSLLVPSLSSKQPIESAPRRVGRFKDPGEKMMMNRYLDEQETLYIGWCASWTLVYEGSIDETALDVALQLLSAEYPVLRAVVYEDDFGYNLEVVPGTRVRLAVLKDGPNDHLSEFGANWNTEAGVAALLLIRGEKSGQVCFLLDHSVADGQAFEAMWRRLWELYSDIVASIEVRVGVCMELPQSMLAVAAKRLGRQPRSEVSKGMKPVVGTRDLYYTYSHLPEEETERLREIVRSRGATVTSLLSAVILIALRKSLPGAGDVRMSSTMPVDLRKRFRQHVDAREATGFASGVVAVVDVGLDADPMLLAREIRGQVEESLANRVPHRMLVEQFDVGAGRKRLRPSTDISNPRCRTLVSSMGEVGGYRTPKSLRFTASKTRPFKQGADCPTFSIYTFNGALWICGRYPRDVFAVVESQNLSERILDILGCTLSGTHGNLI